MPDPKPMSEAERELVEEGRRLYLTKKLVDFSLTREEWGEYEKGVAGSWFLVPGNDNKSFEEFYRQAKQRDETMAKNLIGKLGTSNQEPVTN